MVIVLLILSMTVARGLLLLLFSNKEGLDVSSWEGELLHGDTNDSM